MVSSTVHQGQEGKRVQPRLHFHALLCTNNCKILGQSNFISISLLWGQSVPQQPCTAPVPRFPSTLPSLRAYSFPLFRSNCDPYSTSHTLTFPCNSIAIFAERLEDGIKYKEHWLKNNLFKNYYTGKKNVIPLRQAVWLTPVMRMINDSIFCLCCLLPPAAAAIYHHPLSAMESSSDSASQQTFSTRSRTTRGNYYCQNNNGLA